MKMNFTDRARSFYTNQRWTHIEGMIALIGDISAEFGLDEGFTEKLKKTALLHDTGKKYEFMYRKHPHAFLMHALLSRNIAKEQFKIKDKTMLDAILFHTTGRKKMTYLEIFLYVCDFSEYNRWYEEAKTARDMFLGGKIYETVVYVGRSKINYSKGGLINPNTKEMIEYYEKIC